MSEIAFIMIDFVNHDYDQSPLPYVKENIVVCNVITKVNELQDKYKYLPEKYYAHKCFFRYRLESGDLAAIYVQAPKRQTLGVSYKYYPTKPETDENIAEVNLSYPMQNNNPTKADDAWIQFNNDLYMLSRDSLYNKVKKIISSSDLGLEDDLFIRRMSGMTIHPRLYGNFDKNEFNSEVDIYNTDGEKVDFKSLVYTRSSRQIFTVTPVFKLDGFAVTGGAFMITRLVYIVKEICAEPVANVPKFVKQRIGTMVGNKS